MNRWSRARVSLVAVGDGGRADAPGAVREVVLPGLGVRLEEIVEAADPPRRFVYRVTAGALLRAHRGEIVLLPTESGGTRLVWDVEFATLPLPGLATATRLLVGGELARSLDALAALVSQRSPEIDEGDGAATLFRPALADPAADVSDAELPKLRRAAARILDEQRRTADELQAAGDGKWRFARAYQYVTENQLAVCDDATTAHPSWVLRLVPRFHRYFADNLARATGALAGPPERHWRVAFAALESRRWNPWYGLAKAVQAHIEEDLPRALAGLHLAHYAARCDLCRFRAEYALMSPVFFDAGARLMADIYGAAASPFRLAPTELRDLLVCRFFYDIPRQRRKAFERAERIVRLVSRPEEALVVDDGSALVDPPLE